jgi:integrase/recombinase XerD
MASYLNNGSQRLGYELDRIADDVPEPNRSYLLEFKKYLEKNDAKERTQERRLMELRTICKLNVCKDFRKLTKKETDEIILRINKLKVGKNNRTGYTNKDVADYSKARTKLTFKRFVKQLLGHDKYFSDIKISYSKASSKVATDILTEEDVEKLLGACTNQRDKTIIALLWDSGMRIGELLNIRLKDITLSGTTESRVVITGKTGTRTTPLSVSIPYLATYINQVRANSDKEEPLFMMLEKKKPLDYDSIRKVLNDARERTDITKRIHAHLFRYSRCVYLHKNGMPAVALEKMFGWTNLNMVQHYAKLSSADVDEAFYRAIGIEIGHGTGKPKLQIRICLECHKDNEATAKLCVYCGSDLSKQIDEFREMKKELADTKIILNKIQEKLGLTNKEAIEKVLK